MSKGKKASSHTPNHKSGGKSKNAAAEDTGNGKKDGHAHKAGSKKKAPSHDSLDAQLALMGLQQYEVAGDGNCLFRSLSHQMGGVPDHTQLRSKVVDHMRTHPDLYAPFMHTDESLERRLIRMAKNGVYADNIEIVAFSRAMACVVVIHQLGLAPWIVDAGNEEEGEGGQKNKRVLHVAYHSWEHYNSVVDGGNGVQVSARRVDVAPAATAGAVGMKQSSSAFEKTAMACIPAHLNPDLATVQRLLKEYDNNIGKVVEAFISLDCVEDDSFENGDLDVGVVSSSSVAVPVLSTEKSEEVGEQVDDCGGRKEQAVAAVSNPVVSDEAAATQPATLKPKHSAKKETRKEKKKLQKAQSLAKKRNAAASALDNTDSQQSKNDAFSSKSLDSITQGIQGTLI
ncbi:OTU domain-containing protein 3 [Chytriomyces hyalinus]|nr:OTU domain-containing protein 3 [Chytriomyces hyalinus]